MNKKTIITILLALVTMAGLAKIFKTIKNPETIACDYFTNPLNICSDFHLGRHFFGLVGGFFVGLSVTLWLGMTLGGGYSMT